MAVGKAWQAGVWHSAGNLARWRSFGVACAIAISICTLSACGVASGQASRSSPVPTVQVPPGTAGTEEVETTPGVQACDAADLQGVTRWQGATGSLAGTVILTNHGSAPCSLDGRPQLDIRDGRGKILPTDKAAPRPSTATPAGEVKPDQEASVPFVWSNWCYDKPVGPITVVVTLPGNGGQVDAPVQGPDSASLTDAPRCNDPGVHSTLNVDPFERPEQTPIP